MDEMKKPQPATQELSSDVGDRDDPHTKSFPADVPKLKVLKTLNLLGFFYARGGKHIILHRENADGSKTLLALPNHSKIKGPTLRKICREVGISREAFLDIYYSV